MTQEIKELMLTALMQSLWPDNMPEEVFGVNLKSGWKNYAAHIETAGKYLLEQARVDPDSTSIRSPFTYIRKEYGRETDEMNIPSGKLSLEERYLFPGEGGMRAEKLLEKLRERLDGYAAPSDPNAMEGYLLGESLLSLLEYYVATIPVSEDGISLFDYARMKTALATCLWKNNSESAEVKDDEKVALLVKGDFLGIQKFIFNVTSKGIAKSLKARSLRVQILEMLAVRYLLKELGLSPCNLIYSGGGSFFLLVPSSQKERLDELQKEIDLGALSLEQEEIVDLPIPEQLQLVLGDVALTPTDFKEDFSSKWSGVGETIHARRNKPFVGVNEKGKPNPLFQPIKAVNPTNRQEAEKAYYKKITKRLNGYNGWAIRGIKEEGSWVRPWKVKGLQIDPDIKDPSMPEPYSFGRNYFQLIHPEDSKELKHKIAVHTLINDSQAHFEQNEEEHSFPKPFHYLVRRLPVWKEDTATEGGKPDEKAEFYTIVDRYYRDHRNLIIDEEEKLPKEEDIISFSFLSLKAWERTGTDKLGVLKMDIDYLGEIFKNRTSMSQRSLLHNSALSRSIKWFFEGYINHLLDEKLIGKVACTDPAYLAHLELHPDETFRDNLYVVFSGGDDLLLVGAWDIVMEFAWRLREKFRAFTRGAATISAGLVLVDAKYPVGRFSELVEEANKEAKNYVRELGEEFKVKKLVEYYPKDRVCVLGQVLSWEDLRYAMQIRDTLYHLVTKEGGESKALIQKVRRSMFGFQAMQRQILKSRRINFPRLWRLHYYLRDVKKENQDAVKENIIDLYDKLFKDLLLRSRNSSYIPPNPALIAVGARWAEFMTRKKRDR